LAQTIALSFFLILKSAFINKKVSIHKREKKTYAWQFPLSIPLYANEGKKHHVQIS